MPLTDDETHDLGVLAALISATGRVLDWTTASVFYPADLRGLSQQTLEIVHNRLGAAQSQVGGVSEHSNALWQGLADAGLVGPAVRLKVAIWEKTTANLKAPAPNDTNGALLRPVLQLIGSFLGGLAAVLPPVEAARAYADSLELLVQDQQEGTAPPDAIVNLH